MPLDSSRRPVGVWITCIGACIWTALVIAIGWRFLLTTALGATVIDVTLWAWHRIPDTPLPAPQPPQPGPDDWFQDLCRRAHLVPPLVLDHYPSKYEGAAGHAFYVLITGTEPDGTRPFTVEDFAAFESRLRDVAGLGCTGVTVLRDAQHGGRAVVYMNGIVFVPGEHRCSVKGCERAATWHVEFDPEHHYSALCDRHRADHAYALDHHPYDPEVCGRGAGWWIDATSSAPSHCTDVRAELPDLDGADRECTPDPQPLFPQHLLPADPEEGSGVPELDPPPGPPAWAPPRVGSARPNGAAPGTKGGRMFGVLAASRIPLRRGVLADSADLSPTTASKLLDAWLDVGAVLKIGDLWMAAVHHRTSANVPADGQVEISE